MEKAPVFALILLCFTSVGAFADDPDKDIREVNKRYWERHRQMDKAEMEADREHGKFHEEMDREERKHFRTEFYREREKAYRE